MPVSCHLMPWKQDFDLALTETEALGYRTCEPALRFVRPYASDPDGFRKRLAGHGLSISALYEAYCFTDDAADEATAVACFTDVAKLVKMCGGNVIVIGPGMTRSRGLGPPTSTGLRRAARVMDEVARRCADLGVKACLHPHLWSEIENETEVVAVMDESEALLLCPDTAHLLGAGIDPVALVERYPDRIGHVHLKDLTVGGDLRADPDVNYFGGLPPFCELGKGSVDLRAFVRCLRRIDYQGWVTVELDMSDRPYESLAICRDYLVTQLELALDEAPSTISGEAIT
jgi:inosose dehydratase